MESTSHGNPLPFVTHLPSDQHQYQQNANPANASAVRASLGRDFSVYDMRYGGMSEVYICSLSENNTPTLALKTFQKQLFLSPAYRVSFLNEAINWFRLSGLPHIMPLLGIREIDKRLFIVMPLAGAKNGMVSFRQLLQEKSASLFIKLKCLSQCLFGLHFALSRFPDLVHGDLKPENLLFLGDDIFISDLGLSRIGDDHAGGPIRSTPEYMAPELWDNLVAPNSKTDIYALGLMLWETVSGDLPFSGNNLKSWKEAHLTGQLPAFPSGCNKMETDLLKLAARCLSKEPAVRPRVNQLLEKFKEIMFAADPRLELDMLYEQVLITEHFHKLQQELIPTIVESLYKLGRYELALEEIFTAPPEAVTPRLLYFKSSCLSILRRDEEALSVFQHLLEQDLDEHLKINCLDEFALSLKRLRRFEEAENIYRAQLQLTVSDKYIPRLQNNLATVFIESERFEQAISSLNSLVRSKPDMHTAWANLGSAYVKINDIEKAVESLQTAIRLSPDTSRYQVMLAEAHIQQGDLEMAYQLLDRSFKQGQNTYEWLRDMLLVTRLTNREYETIELMHIIGDIMDKKEVDKFLENMMKFHNELKELSRKRPSL